MKAFWDAHGRYANQSAKFGVFNETLTPKGVVRLCGDHIISEMLVRFEGKMRLEDRVLLSQQYEKVT